MGAWLLDTKYEKMIMEDPKRRKLEKQTEDGEMELSIDLHNLGMIIVYFI